LIAGWDQERLAAERVVLLGNGRLADFLLIDLMCLGLGTIRRAGLGRVFPFERINPDVILEQTDELPCSRPHLEFLTEDCTVLIDATNDFRVRSLSAKMAQGRNFVYASATAGARNFSLTLGADKPGAEPAPDEEPGILTAMLASAMLVDEIRKRVMPLDASETCLDIYQGLEIGPGLMDGQKILQIGAGAIGTFSALGLVMSGAELTLVDFDTVEESNLSRQFLFYDGIGRNKAALLAERLSELGGGSCRPISALDCKIEEVLDTRGYDYVLSCVDNHRARYFLNESARRHGVPLVNGGSSTFGCNAMPYVPGKTACLDCQLGFKLTEETEGDPSRRPSGACFHPSLIMSNQIAGALMIDCLLKCRDGRYVKSRYASGLGIDEQPVAKDCHTKCRTPST
jgi:molybdopterin/thiamine biosynthesis adenylyltransferase